jgi:cytosine/uracil/thiamine/allantoin permease
MEQPAQPDNPEPPTSQILTLTQFHAALATAMLLTTTTPNYHHPHNHDRQHGTTLATTLSYIHFWCATLGFAWWYAAQSARFTTQAWPRQALQTARAG